MAAAVVWADYEGYTWSQLRVRNAKVLYRSVKRMGPDTAPAKRRVPIERYRDTL